MWYSKPLKSSFEVEDLPLSLLRKGERGVISSYGDLPKEIISRLMDLGLGRGEAFSLLHKRPSYYLGVGRERVAMDRELASSLKVLPLGRRGEKGVE